MSFAQVPAVQSLVADVPAVQSCVAYRPALQSGPEGGIAGATPQVQYVDTTSAPPALHPTMTATELPVVQAPDPLANSPNGTRIGDWYFNFPFTVLSDIETTPFDTDSLSHRHSYCRNTRPCVGSWIWGKTLPRHQTPLTDPAQPSDRHGVRCCKA